MKKLLLLVFAFSSLTAIAQTVHFAQGIQKPTTVVNGETNQWKDAITDSNGNAYFLAKIIANQTFGGESFTVTANRSARVLVKYNSSGEIVWKKSTGNKEGDSGTIVLLDSNENPIVIGTQGVLTGTGAVLFRIAVTKYNKENGAVLWEKIADKGTATIKAATITPNGNIHIGITYQSKEEAITWGNISEFFVTSSSNHPFIISLNSDGNEASIKRVTKKDGSEFKGEITSMASGPNNEIYVLGDTEEVSNSGIYVLRMNANKEIEWYIKTGNSEYDYGSSIIYHNQAIYIAGRVNSGASLDFGNSINSTDKIIQMFVAKLSIDGTAQWLTKNTVLDGKDFHIQKLGKLPNGNVSVFGTFKGSKVMFGSYEMTSSAYMGIFPQIDTMICELDKTDGKVLKFMNTSGTWEKALVSAAAPDNSIWIGGDYRGEAFIGTNKLTQFGTANDFNIFIARVTPKEVVSLGSYDFVYDDATLTLYPNPAQNEFSVSSGINTISAVEVLNAQGQVVLAESSYNGGKINVSSLQTGLYFVRIEAEGKNYLKKLLIQ